MRMNSQTRIIVATAIVLAALDITVRFATAPRNCNQDVVTAREFRLTDNSGNIRMTMSTDDSGEPGVKMYDRNGTLRLQLDTWENTPSLILLDRNGSRRVYHGMENADGSGVLAMYGPDGELSGAPVAQMDALGGTGRVYPATSAGQSVGQIHYQYQNGQNRVIYTAGEGAAPAFR